VRTNIDIDDDLLEAAKAALGTDTKKSTVEAALALAIKRHTLREILELEGIGWDGDLDESRRSRFSQADYELPGHAE